MKTVKKFLWEDTLKITVLKNNISYNYKDFLKKEIDLHKMKSHACLELKLEELSKYRPPPYP